MIAPMMRQLAAGLGIFIPQYRPYGECPLLGDCVEKGGLAVVLMV
jgi:hypothetical protein